MKVSIVIPVYNEEKTIEEILRRVHNADVLGMEKEIIVVDDGSTDKTSAVLSKFKIQNSKFKVIHKARNEGKGAAVWEGIRKASGDIVLVQDADLEYSPEEYNTILAPFARREADVVYGSRNARKNPISSLLFYWGGRAVTMAANVLYCASLTDLPTCYKAFRASVIKDIRGKEKGFEFCEEITAKVLKKGHRIYEVPISYNPRSKKEGKKLRWTHGLRALWVLLRERFSYEHKDFQVPDVFIRFLRERQVRKRIPKGARVLDIGCGDGHFLFTIASTLREGAGVDPSLKKERRFSNITLYPETSEEFLRRQEAASFDVIVMLAVLEHLENPVRTLRECRRVLKPGGVLFATTPSSYAQPLLALLRVMRLVSAEEVRDHKRHVSRDELVRMLGKAGFSPESVRIRRFEFGLNFFVQAKNL